MAAGRGEGIIDAKSVSFNEHVRIRIIEHRQAKVKPLVGNQVIAMWEEDSVFYRANITEHLDDGRYKLEFIHYGTGTAKAENIYWDIADTPQGSMIDFYLQQELEGIDNMRRQVREARENHERRNRDNNST